MKKIVLVISFIRLIPHVFFYKLSKNKKTIQYDINRWLAITQKEKRLGFTTLMTFYPQFRNLFYKRLGKCSYLIKWLCPPMNTLFIYTKDIGPGLYIQHGFATIISAKSIGKDCWINQQVTIGYSNATDCPVLGDNVTIRAGAKIIEKVHIGDNSTAGANAVVVKNVPSNCTVVGVPAYIVKRNGVKVFEKL
ncbi:MAG TPA: serine acetyltransferase [Paludibacteraceae bacterium]|nr:serine acetyltransferase [Paludibacteraceae bacterium]HOS37870.1 serine acetyltransferase [Paludibacteraceae bacterium]HPK20456.1 serine acetyltransferase [Paludibacteraceae bacterium]HRU72712.1 serine acetyltransferase [Paludibacteraceae bacterium]